MKFNNLKYYLMLPVVALGLNKLVAQNTPTANPNVETYSVNLSIPQLLRDSTVSEKDKRFVAEQWVGKESPNYFKPYSVSVLIPEDIMDTVYRYDSIADKDAAHLALPPNFVDSLGPNHQFGFRYTYTSAVEGKVTLDQVLKGTNDRSLQLTYRFGKDLLQQGFKQADPCGFEWASSDTIDQDIPENEFHVAPGVYMDPAKNSFDDPLSAEDAVFFKNTLVSHNHTDSTLPGFLTFDITYNLADSTVTEVKYTVHLKKSKNAIFNWEQISDELTDDFELDRARNFIEYVSSNTVDQTILCPFDEEPSEEEVKERVNKPVTVGASAIAGADAYGLGPSASVSIGDHVNLIFAYHFGGVETDYTFTTPNIYDSVPQGPILSTFFQESNATNHLKYNASFAVTVFPAGGHVGFGPSVQLGTESTDSYWANYQIDTQLNGNPLPGNPDKIPTALGENGFTEGNNNLVVAGLGGVVQYVLDNGITFTGGATYGLRELNHGINGNVSVNVPLNIFSGDKNE